MILQRLYELGAPTMCHIIGHGDLDATEVPLEDALRAIHSMGNGVLLSCIPGRLAYYEAGTINGCSVFHRRQAAASQFPMELPDNSGRTHLSPLALRRLMFLGLCWFVLVLLTHWAARK